MQSVTHDIKLSRVSRSSWWRIIVPAAGRAPSLLANVARRCLGLEQGVFDRYRGCSWGDETERRLLDDIAKPGAHFR